MKPSHESEVSCPVIVRVMRPGGRIRSTQNRFDPEVGYHATGCAPDGLLAVRPAVRSARFASSLLLTGKSERLSRGCEADLFDVFAFVACFGSRNFGSLPAAGWCVPRCMGADVRCEAVASASPNSAGRHVGHR